MNTEKTCTHFEAQTYQLQKKQDHQEGRGVSEDKMLEETFKEDIEDSQFC